MKKKQLLETLFIILGSIIVAFAVSTIHSKTELTEGGLIGIELLMLNWFNISPSITAICIDGIFYIIGFLILNKKFRLNAIIGTLTYSIAYYFFDYLNILLPITNNILVSAIIGGILVGVGSGIVVRHIGACGGDDSLALILNKLIKLPLFFCYYVVDIIVILLSLSYLNIKYVPYSLLTAFISSLVIDFVSRKK